MASSLFGNMAQGRPSNPLQAAMRAASEMRGADPQQVMEHMMRSNPQFASFVAANRGKSPEQIARENGIDLGMVSKLFR